MPKAQINGVEELGVVFNTLNKDAEGLIKLGMYNANKLIYSEVKKQIEALPEGHHELTAYQKEGLLSSLYGSKFVKENDTIYFVISVTGYNDHPTEDHPKGQPNILLLRSLERGTSYLHKHPVMRRSLNAAKQMALAAMQKTISEEVQKRSK